MAEGFLKGSGKDNNHRRYKGGGPRPDHNTYKRDTARERNAFWANLSPLEQLVALDKRLGEGVGAEKQRAKIQARLEASPAQAGGGKDLHVKAKDRRAAERAGRPSK